MPGLASYDASVGGVCLQDPGIGAGLVQLEPAAFDRKLDPGAELLAVGLQRVEEWGVYLLDVDATVLHRFNPGGDLDQLARCGLWIGEGTFGSELHAAVNR